MNEPPTHVKSRREFLQDTGRIAATSALAGAAAAHVHAAEDNTIRVALIGCGSRGTGAAADALSVKNGPIKLVALGDLFEGRLTSSAQVLSQRFADQVDVPEDRRFLGFDAYRKAMDCLRPADVAILATPPGFRWVHFTYAVEKALNVFMEKPVTVDGPSTRRMIALSAKADQKNLKVGVGLMLRHCRARRELHERIRSGEIGEIVAMKSSTLLGANDWDLGIKFISPTRAGQKPNDSEVLYQIERFLSFLWASGGTYSDYYIHQIDACCWMKDAWPVKAHALGGLHYRNEVNEQNLDTYSIEYTYPDGTKLFYYGRNMAGCHNEFASFAYGTKGSAVISTAGHVPGRVRTYKGHSMKKADLLWQFPQPEPYCYQAEWDDLIDAIRQDRPYNEAGRGAEASLVASMGRMAAHTGKIVTYDEILHHEHEFAPEVDRLTMDSPAPVQPDGNGQYPVPMPGIKTRREY